MKQDIEELFDTIVRFGKVMSHDATESHEEKAATMLQFSALRFIQENTDTPVSVLASNLRLSKSSATQLVERLVKAHSIERTSDTTDRRITHLTITTSGKEELAALKQKMFTKMEKIFSHLSEHDIKELIRIHKLLLSKLEK